MIFIFSSLKNQDLNLHEIESHADGVNDCGKWIYNMFIEASISGLNLNQFQNSIKQTKKQTGKSYDQICNEFWISHK